MVDMVAAEGVARSAMSAVRRAPMQAPGRRWLHQFTEKKYDNGQYYSFTVLCRSSMCSGFDINCTCDDTKNA